MKKLLVLALVLSMATMANAALTLGTSATQLAPGESAVISITGADSDGSDNGAFYLGLVLDSPGTLDIANSTNLYTGSGALPLYFEDGIAEMLGLNAPAVHVELSDVPAVGQNPKPLNGLLVDGITMTCGGIGDVVVKLFNGNGEELSSITIAQPEPITIGLLGLGAMFLRRRK